jgi:hypothetical protein
MEGHVTNKRTLEERKTYLKKQLSEALEKKLQYKLHEEFVADNTKGKRLLLNGGSLHGGKSFWVDELTKDQKGKEAYEWAKKETDKEISFWQEKLKQCMN